MLLFLKGNFTDKIILNLLFYFSFSTLKFLLHCLLAYTFSTEKSDAIYTFIIWYAMYLSSLWLLFDDLLFINSSKQFHDECHGVIFFIFIILRVTELLGSVSLFLNQISSNILLLLFPSPLGSLNSCIFGRLKSENSMMI